MKLQYFTYFLNPLQQRVLFGAEKKDKNLLLKEILQKKREIPLEYKSRGVEMAFVQIRIENSYLVGRIGKKSLIKKSLPPSKKFEEQEEENWPFCTIIFNLDDNPETGQKIALEYKPHIFPSPASLLKALTEQLNTSLFSFGYSMSVSPVIEKRIFWDIVQRYENKIKKITLSFNAPNLFDLGNKLEGDLKKAAKTYSMTRAKIEFENPEGKLSIPRTALMRQGAEYIAKGGGEFRIQIKGQGKAIVSSSRNIKTKTFDGLELEIKSNKQEALFSILEKIFS